MSAPDPELTPQPQPNPPLPVGGGTSPAAMPGPAAAAESAALTPEEQMARFAQDLKENDWGHQPC